jgi:NADH-quinone oxidoreductase subunit H
MAGRVGECLLGPFRETFRLLLQQNISTEHPDRLNLLLGAALYLGLAGVGVALVPTTPHGALIESTVSIVLWGTVETMTVIAVFLHGWSANTPFPLIGAYRYAVIGLPMMLVSMFVLIAAALPAQSLSASAIVEAQRPMWNVIRQPFGLPLFLLLGLSLGLRGPFNYADAADLASGTQCETSGGTALVWQLARHAMLVAFAAMASTLFLGGYLGPWLPGPVWLALKTALVLAVLVALGHLFARLPPARMLTFIWTLLLPVAFLDLIMAGAESLA